MKKLFLIVLSVMLLTFMGCNPITSNGNDFDNLVRIKNFDKYTALGVGNKNTARSARSLTTDYLTSCGLFGQNPDGTYELLIFEDEQGHEVTQSYYIKNFADYEPFIFLSFSQEECNLSSDFGMGDYTYCVNKTDGKMYNIGDRFDYLNLIGTSQYNAYVRTGENKLCRFSFENELLKIEEVFDYSSVPLKIDIEVVDKFGTYANNCFYINKDDEEITRFSEGVKLNLGFNDRIYIGNNWFDNGELVAAEFVPTIFGYDLYSEAYKNGYNKIAQYDNVCLYFRNNYICRVVFQSEDEYKIGSYFPCYYFVVNENYITSIDINLFNEVVNENETNIVKRDFYNRDIVEIYKISSFSHDKNTFSGIDENWNKIEGYIDSEGNIVTDMTEYENESIKITFISALN